jgi:hypothetical protein
VNEVKFMSQEAVDEFVEYLFHNGAGEEATHLKLYQDGDVYLGGWCKQAVRDKVSELIAAERERLIALIPSSWLDSMLSGPNAVVGKPPWGCPDIERVLQAVKEKLRAGSDRRMENNGLSA